MSDSGCRKVLRDALRYQTDWHAPERRAIAHSCNASTVDRGGLIARRTRVHDQYRALDTRRGKGRLRRGERPVTRNMRTYAIISRSSSQPEKLRDDFSDFIVNPGYTSHFGSAHDDMGFVYIPGASVGFHQTRKVLRVWLRKSTNDDRYDWWAKALKERGYDPVRVSHRNRASRIAHV